MILSPAPAQLVGDLPPGGDPGDAAFDRVDELCADGPVVLWTDDAHNLDAAYADAGAPAGMGEPEPAAGRAGHDPAVSGSRAGDDAHRQAQVRLRLPPMGPMMVERLVHDRTGRWPGPRLRRILGLAAGNPLFVTELLRAYQNAGALAEAGPDTIEARFELDLRATGLDEVIRAHLGQLDEPTRDVLAALAVWGADIGVGELASMLPIPAAALDEPLERAIASGLVRRDPAGTVGFSHDLFREVTYGELAEPQRRAGAPPGRGGAGGGWLPADPGRGPSAAGGRDRRRSGAGDRAA